MIFMLDEQWLYLWSEYEMDSLSYILEAVSNYDML